MKQYVFWQKENRTVLLDKIGVIAALCDQAEREREWEHCVLALAKRTGEAVYELFDSCIVEEIGGSTGRNISNIPQKVSLALISLCVKQRAVPVILHTHPSGAYLGEPVTFSDKDRIFIEKFSAVAIEMGMQDPCLFLVTDGQSILLCAVSDRTQQYAREEK
ncbi:MAG: hypothetical protein J6J87_08585 [Oscillospiraceae bacterium]|nr:hypothetical protein [Oscillospiraceae bacterium]